MAHLDRRFSRESRVLVYVEQLKESRVIMWNGHRVALGEPGEYWCTWEGCTWIESRASYLKHYHVVWQGKAPDQHKMFSQTTLTSTVAHASFQVFLKGRDDPTIVLGHPRDKLLEFASGASYILRQESRSEDRVLTPCHIPLYVDTSREKRVEIT